MTPYSFEPQHADTKSNVTAGLLNTGLTQAISIIVQFASIIFLSRLLPPSDFGLLAMVSPIYGFVMLFQDVGLNQATVQRPQIGHSEINAFFWINTAVGLLLALLLAVLSPLAGWYYADGRIVTLTIAMGFLVLVSAVGNQHSAILQRRMQFRAIAIINIIGTLSSLIGALLWAYFIGGYWALYIGMLLGTSIPTIGAWVASRWRPSKPFIPPGIRDMLMFGVGITSTNVMGFFARNLDNVLIGRAWGNEQLGLYDRAYKLLMFPLQRLVGPLGGVMVPVLSRLHADPEKYRHLFTHTLGQLTFILWPGILWVLCTRGTLIPILLGKNWLGAAAVFGPLAVASFAQVINNPTGWLFITQGRSGDFARTGAITAVTSILAFILGLPYGAVGVATAYAISEYLRTPLIWWYATKSGPIGYAQIFRSLSPQLTGLAAAGVAVTTFLSLVTNPLVLLCGSLILSYGIFTAAMLCSAPGRETLRQTFSVFHHFLKKFKRA